MKRFVTITALTILSNFTCLAQSLQYDICIYGATSAGVIAAYTAKQHGKSVIIFDPNKHIGGLSAGGLGQTDIGNKYAISGLSRNFYREIGQHYGRFEQWTFEPKVAKGIFLKYLKSTDKVLLDHELLQVIKNGAEIKSIKIKSKGKTIEVKAKMYIDCTYEGDLMALSKVTYTVGRESNAQYGETWNGVQLLDKHQLPDGIDPFKIKGNKKSPLLWGISPEPLAKVGTGDNKVQAYNFRMCLTDSAANRIAITKPQDYDPSRYELLLRYIEKKKPLELNWALMHLQPMPHHKLDINNSGPFSTNLIGGNYDYPNASMQKRREIQKRHEDHIKGFFYFLGHDKRVPEHLRKEMLQWGYPKDEYVENNHFSPQMYIREARRMVSEVVMTEAHCVGDKTVSDGIGLAAYTMDSHNTQRVIVKDSSGQYQVKNEGDVQKGLGGLDPYPISYKSIIPRQNECVNLAVPVCLSASHIAFGSIRMEPVFMVLAQAAATAASLAIDNGQNLHQISVPGLQLELKNNPLADGGPADLLIDNADEQHFTVVGDAQIIKKGYGRYGNDYHVLKNAEASFSAIFPQDLLRDLYIYIPRYEGQASEIEVKVNINGGTILKKINLKEDENDWYFIGKFETKKDQKGKLIMRNTSEKPIVADAILWTKSLNSN